MIELAEGETVPVVDEDGNELGLLHADGRVLDAGGREIGGLDEEGNVVLHEMGDGAWDTVCAWVLVGWGQGVVAHARAWHVWAASWSGLRGRGGWGSRGRRGWQSRGCVAGAGEVQDAARAYIPMMRRRLSPCPVSHALRPHRPLLHTLAPTPLQAPATAASR